MRKFGRPIHNLISTLSLEKMKCTLCPRHGKCSEIWDIYVTMNMTNPQGDKGDVLRASAICTPAIAEGLSSKTSASLHASQESTRSKGWPH